jgi:hypothetical protein
VDATKRRNKGRKEVQRQGENKVLPTLLPLILFLISIEIEWFMFFMNGIFIFYLILVSITLQKFLSV